MSKGPTKAELTVENWNLKHPVGTPVFLLKDDGSMLPTKTRSPAEVSASGHAVCWFEGVRGYYILERATLRAELSKGEKGNNYDDNQPTQA